MMKVEWAKGPNGWLTLEDHNFSGITAVGVYVIWCNRNPATVVRVGSGIIGARITAHKSDPMITRHKTKGTLHITWAVVPEAQMQKIERYLADQYQPLEGDRYPDVPPLVVNLVGS